MANALKGTISAPASTGNQTISLASDFDPKAIIVWSNGATSDGLANANGRISIGFGTYRSAAVNQGYTTFFSPDNLGSSAPAEGVNTTALCKLFSANTPTVALNVALVSMSTGATSNVVLNFVTTLSGAVVHYWILGGSDISDALVGNFLTTTGVATQDVTVASGFTQPDLIFYTGLSKAALADVAGDGAQGFGFGKSDTEQWYTMMFERGAASADCSGAQRANIWTSSTGGGINGQANLSARASWPTDGFQWSYTSQPASQHEVIYLALKGTFPSTIGNTTIPTAVAPQTQNLTIASGTPVGAMMVQWPGPAQATATTNTNDADLGGLMVGGTDGTNEGCAGWTEDDANTTSCTGTANSTAKAFQGVVADSTLANPPILQSECDSSISGSDVVLTWGNTDAVARAYGYVLVGTVATVVDTPDVVMAPLTH